MSQAIFNKEQQLELIRLGVQALYLFGSRAQGLSGPASDYDYAVLMSNSGYQKADPVYFELYNLLSQISPRSLDNDVIDIVFLRDAPLELKFHVVRYGKVLFEYNIKQRLDFESHTTLMYCDYRPVLDKFDKAILESL